MITKNIQKLPNSIVELQITVPWTDLASKWDEAVNRVSNELELPGFRKGQAPADLVEQRSGSQIQQEVLKVVMPQALMEALQGTDVVPIDYPQYQLVGFSKGTDLNFKARVTTRPTVTVGNYKTIKVQKPPMKPTTDEDVNKIIEDLFKRYKARMSQNPPTPTPIPTQSGPIKSGPTSPSAQGAAGSLSFNKSDSPDDAFAKTMGAESLEDLKKKIREDLEAEARYNNELDYEEAILQEIEKITTVDLPEVLIQDELNRMLVSLQRRVADMGLLMEDYLKGQGKTLDQLKKEWRGQAEKNVRMELGLSDIARQENVNISDQELQAEIDKIQDNRLKQQFESEEPRMHLRHALRQTKTLNLLKGLVG